MVISHPTLGLVNMAIRATSPNPDQQVADTIALMREYVNADAHSPEIQRDIRAAGAQYGGGIQGLYAFVKSRMRFTQDHELSKPVEGITRENPVVEVLIRPVDLSNITQTNIGTGDCDDYSMYLAALLVGAGIPASFVTVAADPELPRDYSHVYVAAYPSGGRAPVRIPMDASHGQYVGWEVANRFGKIREWPIWGRVGNFNRGGSGIWD